MTTRKKVDAGKVAEAAATAAVGEVAQEVPVAAAVIQLFHIVKLLHENPHQRLEDHTSHPDFVGSALHGLLGL